MIAALLRAGRGFGPLGHSPPRLSLGLTALVGLSFLSALLLGGGGCAYPRRSTSISPAPGARTGTGSAPSYVWKLEFRSATIPPRDRSGHAWDDDDGPDPFIRLYRGDELLWESEAVHNSLEPSFDVSLPRNVYLPPDQSLRVELWDADASNHIIGVWRGTGLPANAIPDADARIMLDGGASVLLRVHPPETHRGIGISQYEARGKSLRVLHVERFSPAGRAGIAPGDDITAIGGTSIGDLGTAAAASALSMAMDRQTPLQIVRGGQPRSVTVDRDLTWLSM